MLRKRPGKRGLANTAPLSGPGAMESARMTCSPLVDSAGLYLSTRGFCLRGFCLVYYHGR